jgi:hypothetical protein
MYSKQQASQVRQEFWTAFGKYMQPVLSSEGEKVNWINYKTGAKNIFFRMQAGKGALIGIELTHADESQRKDHFDKFLQLRSLFRQELKEEWIWHESLTDEHGKIISRIYTELKDVNIFNREDWPALISFFKPRITALDAFWNNVKYGFDVW